MKSLLSTQYEGEGRGNETTKHQTEYIHLLMRDEKEGIKKEGQTNDKAKQHSTPKVVIFPPKNERH